MKKLITALSIFFFFAGCEHSFSPEYTLAYKPKVVTSLILTNEVLSNRHIPLDLKVWHYNGSITTVNFSQIKNLYISSNPYYKDPEESANSRKLNIFFKLPIRERVRISILPARFPWEDPQEVLQRMGAASFKVQEGGEIIVDEVRKAGSHAVSFDPYQLKLPTGVYTMRIEIKQGSFERTLYIVNRCQELYSQLLEYVRCSDE